MTLFFTTSFKKKAARLSQKDDRVRQQFKKQFQIFQQNPRHASLRLHKLQGKRSEQFAIWIIGDLRALAIKDGDTYTFFDVVTHDEY